MFGLMPRPFNLPSARKEKKSFHISKPSPSFMEQVMRF
jgi:hypothetical protein